MKLVMDEKLKHRLVGVSVILSLGAIFLPAMMKKSSQRLENNFSVNVKLPPKPVAPNVAITDEEAMFKTIKIARVSLPSSENTNTVNKHKTELVSAAPVDEDEGMPLAKFEPALESLEKPLALALNNAANVAVKKEIKVAASVAVKPVITAVKTVKTPIAPKKPMVAKVIGKPAVKQEIYAVQLASFSKLANAQSLVNKLHQKGYKANYIRSTSKKGPIYKVYAGHSPVKNNVVKLKTQLASAMQLNGFVVNTGVS